MAEAPGSPEAHADLVALGQVHDDDEVGRAHALSRHELRPVHGEIHAMARGRRNRLGWLSLSGVRSNHLSYRPYCPVTPSPA